MDCFRNGRMMLKAKLEQVATICTHYAWSIILVAGVLALAAGNYVVRHFALDTDINKLISPDLPWRQRELAFSRAFPQRIGTIFAVIDAPTADLAGRASSVPAQTLLEQKGLFNSIEEPRASPF